MPRTRPTARWSRSCGRATSGSRTTTAAGSAGWPRPRTRPSRSRRGRPTGRSSCTRRRSPGTRQIRVFRLPTGPSARIEASGSEEWSATYSRNGRLAFVSDPRRRTDHLRGRAGRNGSGPVRCGAAGGATDRHPPSALVAGRQAPRLHECRRGRHDDDRRRRRRDADAGHAAGTAQRPVWSPAGTRIAFDDGLGHLQSVAADGTDPRDLGSGAALDWRVVPVGTPKFPNLVQRPPSELVVTRSARGRWLLGFTSMVDNRGPGILWIRANRPSRVEGHARAPARPARRRRHARPAPFAASSTTSSRRRTTTGTSSASTATSSAAPATSRCSCATTRAGSASPTTGARAIGVSHGPPRFLGDCEQFQPEARAVEEGLVGRLHRPLSGELPRPEPRRDARPGRPLLARAPHELRLPPPRGALRRRRGLAARPHRVAARTR